MLPLDVTIARTLNAAGLSAPILTVFLAKYLVFFMVAVPVVGTVTRAGRRLIGGWLVMLRAMLTIGLGMAGNFLLSLAFYRVRPFLALDGVEALLPLPLITKSYPSDHATAAFAIAWTVFLVRPKAGGALLVLATLVGVGRVMAGLHFPTDVLAGALIALPWSWLVARALPVAGESILAIEDDDEDDLEVF